MMEPYILLILAIYHGQVETNYMELKGKETCENAKRKVEQVNVPADFEVVAVCFPKEISARF